MDLADQARSNARFIYFNKAAFSIGSRIRCQQIDLNSALRICHDFQL